VSDPLRKRLLLTGVCHHKTTWPAAADFLAPLPVQRTSLSGSSLREVAQPPTRVRFTEKTTARRPGRRRKLVRERQESEAGRLEGGCHQM
jgi:hypothetical protein